MVLLTPVNPTLHPLDVSLSIEARLKSWDGFIVHDNCMVIPNSDSNYVMESHPFILKTSNLLSIWLGTRNTRFWPVGPSLLSLCTLFLFRQFNLSHSRSIYSILMLTNIRTWLLLVLCSTIPTTTFLDVGDWATLLVYNQLRVQYLDRVETYRENSMPIFVGLALSAWRVAPLTTMIRVNANRIMVTHIVWTYRDWIRTPSIFLKWTISLFVMVLFGFNRTSSPAPMSMSRFAMPMNGNFPFASYIVRSAQDHLLCLKNLPHHRGRHSIAAHPSLWVETHVFPTREAVVGSWIELVFCAV